jgi:hypothetical protein
MIPSCIELVERGYNFPVLKTSELVQLTDLLFSWLQANPREGWVVSAFEGALDALIIQVAFRPKGEPYYKTALMYDVHQGMV